MTIARSGTSIGQSSSINGHLYPHKVELFFPEVQLSFVAEILISGIVSASMSIAGAMNSLSKLYPRRATWHIYGETTVFLLRWTCCVHHRKGSREWFKEKEK